MRMVFVGILSERTAERAIMTIIKKVVSVAGDRIMKAAFFELMAEKILYRGGSGFGESEVQKATMHKAKMYHHIRPTRSGILKGPYTINQKAFLGNLGDLQF
jgi:hypothetical protein